MIALIENMPLVVVSFLITIFRIFTIISVRLTIVDRVLLTLKGVDVLLHFLELIALSSHIMVISIYTYRSI